MIQGQWSSEGPSFCVTDKFSGTPVAQISAATPGQVRRAIDGAAQAQDCGAPPPAERAAILRRTATLIAERRQAFVDAMVAEAGFTLSDAAGEVDRALITLQLTAEECTRLVGDMVPFAASPGAHQRLGYTVRHPIGIVCAITPFNSPLNTVLHKVAPAFGAGNAVILKPSALTPLTVAVEVERVDDEARQRHRRGRGGDAARAELSLAVVAPGPHRAAGADGQRVLCARRDGTGVSEILHAHGAGAVRRATVAQLPEDIVAPCHHVPIADDGHGEEVPARYLASQDSLLQHEGVAASRAAR